MIIFQKYLSAEVGYIYTISINQRIKRIKLIDCFVLQVLECLAFHSIITFSWYFLRGEGPQALTGLEVWCERNLTDGICDATFKKSNCVIGIYIRKLDIMYKTISLESCYYLSVL